jgi:hypothetical protein
MKLVFFFSLKPFFFLLNKLPFFYTRKELDKKEDRFFQNKTNSTLEQVIAQTH